MTNYGIGFMAEQRVDNIFADIPATLGDEVFVDLLRHNHVRIERILSQGQTSPAEGWYDQDEHEWVLVVEGRAIIAFENGEQVTLEAGDYLNIPQHRKHRVAWTDPDRRTLWLAVFYR